MSLDGWRYFVNTSTLASSFSFSWHLDKNLHRVCTKKKGSLHFERSFYFNKKTSCGTKTGLPTHELEYLNAGS